MNLMHIKLRSGEELVADIINQKIADEEGPACLLLSKPVQVIPTGNGISAREWLYFSETNEVWLSVNDMMYINEANEDAIEFYDRIVLMREDHESAKKHERLDDMDMDDIRELFDTLVESKNSIKH